MTFFKDLLQRRVPQILGIYLATSWAIIEFLDWLINQFSISPHLSKFGLITLASMLPTVLLLAYFHGKPGRDTWTRVEKIGIPINLLGAALLLIFIFKGEDLGAATSLVSMENEEGQTVERVVPKPEFRKKIMLYFLENKSGDPALDWLSYGITELLHIDLIQDYYMETADLFGGSSQDQLNEAGYSDLTGLPLMLEKELAEDRHLDFFLTGSFTKQNNTYLVNAKLYRTRNGKLIREYDLDNSDIMDLVDDLTVLLKKDLNVPAYHMEETMDLPVMEITTGSLLAYEWYIMGGTELLLHNDITKLQEYLNNAIREDPTFALAYWSLTSSYLSSNQSDKGEPLFEPLMNHLYKLPERIQFLVKISYFDYKQEYDKQFAVAEMVVQLFPDDIEARLTLTFFYKIRNQIDEAIEEYKYILELDPQRYTVLNEIGLLYEQQGKYKDAINYYARYADQFPDRPESFRSLGRLYSSSGNFEDAKSNFDKALLLDPENISDHLQVANIEFKTGHFDQALAQFHEALDRSSSSREKAQVYSRLQYFHEVRGERKKALEYLYLKHKEWEETYIPLRTTSAIIQTFDHFVKLESEDVILETLEILRTELDTLIKNFISIGYMYWYLEVEDVENAEKEIVKMEDFIAESGWDVMRAITLKARGRFHEIRGEFDLAIQKYSELLEIDATNYRIYIDQGRCFRNQNNHKNAEEVLQKALTIHPFEPDANFEMSLVYHETGRNEMALEHLNRTLTIWEHADPDYGPAQLAREKLAEWEMN